MALIPSAEDYMAMSLPSGKARSAEVLDAVMAGDVHYNTRGHALSHALGNAEGVVKKDYNLLWAKANVSSHSMDEIYHACPRKWAIKKMQANAGTFERINSPTFAFGHAVGAGVACLDETGDLRAAILAAFLSWDIDLLEEEIKGNRQTGKSFHEAVWALYVYRQFREEETDMADYEVVKAEATVVVDFEDGHYYVGHIDELLRNKFNGKYRVKENKTTGLTNVDPAFYSNSPQALSYSIVIDMLGGQDYEVLYTVYSASDQQWRQFSFIKKASQKAEWLQDQLLMHQQREDYQEVKLFPKRGGACMDYMKRCEFYETCDVPLAVSFNKEFSDLPRILNSDEIREIEAIDYFTTVSEIVARQKEKVKHGS